MQTSPSQSGYEPDPPFLETDPPHWAARGLSTVIIAVFAVAVVAAAVVNVPETVAGPFVLVPERGADPVRSAREGTVADVRAVEGQSVAKGRHTVRDPLAGRRRSVGGDAHARHADDRRRSTNVEREV